MKSPHFKGHFLAVAVEDENEACLFERLASVFTNLSADEENPVLDDTRSMADVIYPGNGSEADKSDFSPACSSIESRSDDNSIR